MEIKDFIKDALAQIVDGVKNSNSVTARTQSGSVLKTKNGAILWPASATI